MELLNRRKYIFANILNDWLKTKINIKIQSYQKYENLINNYINKYLGNISLKRLTKKDIDDFFYLQEKNDVCISTQKALLYIIKSSLDYSYSKGYCSYIDLKDIRFKSNNKSIYILSKKEQSTLEKMLKTKTNIRKICLLLCLYTGLRVGEVSGLKWEDIDFNTKSLEIKRTIQRIKNSNRNIHSKTILIASTPKSETSNRVIPIPDFLIEMLKEFKTENRFYLLSNSDKLYDPRLFESFYARIIEKCNITYNKFHTLRHTFATRSIESKMDIKTLSEILGHSSIEITLKLYVHPSYDMKKNSIESLVQFMVNC